jgi:hypothetical protein
MNHLPVRGPSPRPPRLRRARVAVVITATAGLALVAACGASPSSTGSAGSPNAAGATSTAAQAVAYTQCMRSHGVPEYPGPDSSGQLQKIGSGQQVGVSDAQLNTASNACQSLWPYQGLTATQQQQELTDMVKFAQCMRSHGVPTLPDPVATDGKVEFVISTSKTGINPQSPQIQAKLQECLHVLPAGMRPSAVTTP